MEGSISPSILFSYQNSSSNEKTVRPLMRDRDRIGQRQESGQGEGQGQDRERDRIGRGRDPEERDRDRDRDRGQGQRQGQTRGQDRIGQGVRDRPGRGREIYSESIYRIALVVLGVARPVKKKKKEGKPPIFILRGLPRVLLSFIIELAEHLYHLSPPFLSLPILAYPLAPILS